MLPTLGMNKYRDVDLAINQRNPFKVQNNTEKLLVVKEREREFKEFNKLEKEGQRVFQKDIGSRPTRQGVIREIRQIKASHSTTGLQSIKGGKLAMQTSQDEVNQNKQKINIFDQ